MLLEQGKIQEFCTTISFASVRVFTQNHAQLNNECEMLSHAFEQKHIFDSKEERC